MIRSRTKNRKNPSQKNLPRYDLEMAKHLNMFKYFRAMTSSGLLLLLQLGIIGGIIAKFTGPKPKKMILPDDKNKTVNIEVHLLQVLT